MKKLWVEYGELILKNKKRNKYPSRKGTGTRQSDFTSESEIDDEANNEEVSASKVL